ncbi:unnamed protein product [Rotaria magnacalcarata]|uniref:Uncharacterized protein n=1 Tax=Rotaria magnacalcarata TaxID=392030 RepID=A0A820EL07_9BILA|nr:unnamed protein product [Rotaria magnacalcarata]
MAATDVINQQNLIETGLFHAWSYAAFNELKNVKTSEKVSLDSIVECMGNDLRANGLNELIGISRTHNHFKLHPYEVLQVTLGSSINDPTVKVDSGATVVHLNPVKLESLKATPIPYMWAYDKEAKQFFPMQFFDGSNIIMQQRFDALCSNEKLDKLVLFLTQFADHVERTGTQDDLGFYIHYEDLMTFDNESGQDFTLMEETDVRDRCQWVTPKTKDMLQAFLIEKQKTEQLQLGIKLIVMEYNNNNNQVSLIEYN